MKFRFGTVLFVQRFVAEMAKDIEELRESNSEFLEVKRRAEGKNLLEALGEIDWKDTPFIKECKRYLLHIFNEDVPNVTSQGIAKAEDAASMGNGTPPMHRRMKLQDTNRKQKRKRKRHTVGKLKLKDPGEA